MSRVFFSHAIGANRLPFVARAPQDQWESSHWNELATAYRDGLLACGQEIKPILRPEIYQSEVARQSLGVTPGDWHLVVKPIEHIRPFHDLANVFVSDWPFPTLSRQTGGISPFFDQVRLLNQADAVACCTESTSKALHAAGVTHAIHAPPFRPARTGLGISPFRTTPTTCTVMAVADAHSLVRLHTGLIRGFASARAQNRQLRLTLVVRGAGSTPASVLRAELLAASNVGDGDGDIVVTLEPLTTAIYQGEIDFFLWEGVPFGLPLPLIDAALAGVTLIAPACAAATVDLAPTGFIRLATESRPVEAIDESVVQVMPLDCDLPTADAICDALLVAGALGGEERASLARVARREIESRFGLQAFRTGLARIVDHLVARRHDACR